MIRTSVLLCSQVNILGLGLGGGRGFGASITLRACPWLLWNILTKIVPLPIVLSFEVKDFPTSHNIVTFKACVL